MKTTVTIEEDEIAEEIDLDNIYYSWDGDLLDIKGQQKQMEQEVMEALKHYLTAGYKILVIRK